MCSRELQKRRDSLFHARGVPESKYFASCVFYQLPKFSCSSLSRAAMVRGIVLCKMVMVSRLTVILAVLSARTSAFHVPAASRSVLPSSSNKMMQSSSCIAPRGHRQRSSSQLEAKKKKKSALKGPASDALAQIELLEALEAEMEGVMCEAVPHSLPSVAPSPSLPRLRSHTHPHARTVAPLARPLPFVLHN